VAGIVGNKLKINIMKKHIFENKYYFSVLIISFSLLVLLIDKEKISSLIKYPLMLVILVFSIYLNPIMIITTFIDQQVKTTTEKFIRVFSYILLSVIFAFIAIFLFSKSENVLYVAKIICIINFVFLIVSYVSKGENKSVVINHLIVSLVFSALISIL